MTRRWNLDVGSGPFSCMTDCLKKLNIVNITYDPYWFSQRHNLASLSKAFRLATTATFGNVLNVIRSRRERSDVMWLVRAVMKEGNYVYFSVYSGDKSSNCITYLSAEGERCYQANRPLKSYLGEVTNVFPGAYLSGNLLIASIARKSRKRG